MLRMTYLFDLKKYTKRSTARYESGHTSVDWRLNWGHTILFYFGTVRSTPDGLMAVLCLPADTVRNLPRRASDQRQSSLPPPSVAPSKTLLPAPPHCRGCAAPSQSTNTRRHPDPAAAVPSTHATLKDSHLSAASAANLRPRTLTLDTSQPAA